MRACVRVRVRVRGDTRTLAASLMALLTVSAPTQKRQSSKPLSITTSKFGHYACVIAEPEHLGTVMEMLLPHGDNDVFTYYTAAFEILSDAKKRRVYDLKGKDAFAMELALDDVLEAGCSVVPRPRVNKEFLQHLSDCRGASEAWCGHVQLTEIFVKLCRVQRDTDMYAACQLAQDSGLDLRLYGKAQGHGERP